MAEASIHSLTSTLATQSLSMSDPSQHTSSQTGGGEPVPIQPTSHATQGGVEPPPMQGLGELPVPVNPDNTNSETPIKRRPGRPKGSGKKVIDANAEPKIKRPVGRPRKDGLPAGSVGPRRASRPRKRPPGTFASGPQSTTGVFPYAPSFSNFVPPIDPTQPQWRASISAPPMGSLSHNPRAPSQMTFPIDPSLNQENWAELARTRPDAFLQTLVSALASPNPVSAGGPSVEEAFKSHLVSLAPNSKNTPSIPSLYSILKTFWLPSSPVYFSLTASASTARTPSDHRFLYWDPQPLVFNGIACPACSAPLINRGRIISGPIKVYDLDKPFFIIGCEYVCKGPACVAATSPDGRKFASTDTSILRALPSKLKDEFPAHLLQGSPDLGSGSDVWNWHGMGVSIALWNMVRACLRAGLRKESILDIVKSIQGGVSDNGVAPGEEEAGAAEQEEEEEDENQDAAQVEGDLDFSKDKSTEEFNEAWNANSGTADGNSVQEQAGPSNPPDANGHAHQQAVTTEPSMVQRPPQYPQFTQTPYAAYPYPPYPFFQPPPSQPGQHLDPNGANSSVLKRTFSIVDGSPDPNLGEPLQKRVRHCCKCGSNDCKGKGGRAFCMNPCQDCGKLECKGRNSKRPDRTCEDAWP
ncbi:hypothetical protein AcW1_008450 [Taiwanofungus camphoratus]|nr:hypothetical protein AcV5_008744 [Antrodia cinnamomea]KAI0951401.1 hypothetical protein AcW1_008450 [Antrodia cinnamomea]KAI0956303.1 hypothetical protein AcV7_006739 [Antrodia cinnamomea]